MNWQGLKQASLDDIVAWAESQPWCRAMADCAQDAEWHSEGDVWTHTKMVCQQLPELEAWPTLTSDEQTLLIFTALFHDAARPLTSEADPETGRIATNGHPTCCRTKLAMTEMASRQFSSCVRPDETRGLKLWSPSGSQCKRI